MSEPEFIPRKPRENRVVIDYEQDPAELTDEQLDALLDAAEDFNHEFSALIATLRRQSSASTEEGNS